MVKYVFKTAFLSLIAVVLLLPGISVAQSLRPEEIYQKLLPSIMTLRVQNVRGESYIGTAFLALDQDVAVTAWHVVSDATNVTAKFSDDRVVSVDRLIDKDEAHDLALVHLAGAGRPKAPLCFADPLVGSRAYVIGAPKGFDFSITDGLVSQIQKIHGSAEYQVSCPISGGNSGGPIVNDRGEVLGIAAWTQRDAQNLSFAIPAAFLERLNPKHSPITWAESSRQNPPNLSTARDLVKTSETQKNVSDLKQTLATLAGEHVTITISSGDTEKKFDIVLPKNFVK